VPAIPTDFALFVHVPRNYKKPALDGTGRGVVLWGGGRRLVPLSSFSAFVDPIQRSLLSNPIFRNRSCESSIKLSGPINANGHQFGEKFVYRLLSTIS